MRAPSKPAAKMMKMLATRRSRVVAGLMSLSLSFMVSVINYLYKFQFVDCGTLSYGCIN